MNFDASNLVCSQRYRNKVTKRAREVSTRTGFLDNFISKSLINEGSNTHTPIMQGRFSDFSHVGSLHAEDALEGGKFDARDWDLFTNPLRIPSYGPGYAGQDEPYAKRWEKPSDRPIIGNFWVFTLEYDPDDASGFQQQLDWLWKKTKDGGLAIAAFDKALRQEFRDYRGYTAVWTGNKSIHFHFVFDTTWLDRAALENWAEINGSNPKHALKNHYEGDIDPSRIWVYYQASWLKLVAQFQKVTGIAVEFDPGMRILSQKRRFPWGERVEGKDTNIHGYQRGDRIPQIVLEERIGKEAPKGASGYFLRASEANAMDVPARTRSHKPRVVARTAKSEEALLSALIEHLEAEWGSPYPKPARIDIDGGVSFFNHAGDRNPSTYLGPDHTFLSYRGRGAPTDPRLKHLPGHLSLADTMYILADRLDEADGVGFEVVDVSPPRRPRWPGSVVIDHVFERKVNRGSPRAAMLETTPLAMGHSPYTLVKSAEGVGKSHAVLNHIISHRIEDWVDNRSPGLNQVTKKLGLTHPGDGFILFASSSYAQSEEQFRNYTGTTGASSRPDPSKPAVLLKSFARWYREYWDAFPPGVAAVNRITWINALQNGYRSLLDAVFDEQPDVYREITRRKNAAWKVPINQPNQSDCGFKRRFGTPVFCPYDLAHSFHRPTPSAAWLHPDFDYERHAEEFEGLTKDFRVYLMVHDEISIDDLLWSASPEEVSFAQAVKDSGQESWSELSMAEKYKTFGSVRSTFSGNISFERTLDLIDANFTESNRIKVRFEDLPFGHDNGAGGLYKGTDGQEIYLKQKTWWRDCKGRVIFLTTEDLVTEIATALRWPSGVARVPEQKFTVFKWDQDRFFEVEYLPLRLESRASKTNVNKLVGELLDPNSGGFDHVITNHAQLPGSITHASARGRNDMDDKNIAVVLTYLGPEQYVLLNAISQRFGIEEPTKSFYRDQINQAAGRNRGLRRTQGNFFKNELFLSQRLYLELGGRGFFRSGRYQYYQSKEALALEHGSLDGSQANRSGTGPSVTTPACPPGHRVATTPGRSTF